MSEPAQALRPVATQSVKANQVFIVGRVHSSRKRNNVYRTIVNSASPDSFSHPGKHEITSSRHLGKPGEEVRVLCSCDGYAGKFTDKESGEVIQTVNNSLTAIEEA